MTLEKPHVTQRFRLMIASDGDVKQDEIGEALEALGYHGVWIQHADLPDEHECPCPSRQCCDILREHGHLVPSDVQCCTCWYFGRSVAGTGQVSDGYHTFDELYEHRRALTAGLCIALPDEKSWRSKAHHPEDGPIFEGYFIVGIDLPSGTITYHYSLDNWKEFDHVRELPHAPKWDGADASETPKRINAWIWGTR